MLKLFHHGNQNFAIYISKRLPTDFGKENTEKFANFLWSMLKGRPEDRESTTGLLNHPFLVGRRGGVPCWSQCLQRSRVVKQQLVKQRRNIKYVFVYREAMCLIYWISNSRIHDNKE